MGSTLILKATRDCMVVQTGGHFTQTKVYRDLWEPKDETIKKLLSSIEPVQSYMDWVFEQDEQTDQKPLTHCYYVLEWINDCEKDGYVIKLEIL